MHLQLGTPVVWVWDNLSVHLRQELIDFAEEYKDWLAIFHLPPYAPEINPQEGGLEPAQACAGRLRCGRPGAPDPGHQAEAEEDPVPASSDHRLSATHRPGPHGPDRHTGHRGFNLSTQRPAVR
ncbi:transposase [Streptomyces spectabilis]|uniref:transposase n=1 Tax=Streptomyces spectabilis TaxID=68270 RepID=UPI002892EA6D|nr:transposase [Streptomyces spectabilis]